MTEQELRDLFDQMVADARLIADPFERAVRLVEIAQTMAESGIDPYMVFQEAIAVLRTQPASVGRDWAIAAAQEARRQAWAAGQAARAPPPPAPVVPPAPRGGVLAGVVRWYRRTGWATLILSILFVIGWSLAAFLPWLLIACSAGVLLTLLIIAGLLPAELVAAVGDVLFKDKNRIDDVAKSVRLTLTIAVGLLTVLVIPAHYAQLPALAYLPLFAVLLLCPLVGAAALQKALAFEALRRSRLAIGIGMGAAMFGTVAAVAVLALRAQFKDNADALKAIDGAVLAALCVIAVVATIAGALWVFKYVYQKLDDSGHGGLMAGILATVASFVILSLGIKGALVLGAPSMLEGMAKVMDSAANLTNAEQGQGHSPPVLPKDDGTGAAPPPSGPIAGVDDDAPLPTPSDGAEQKKDEKPKELTKAQLKAEIAQLEKSIVKDFGPDTPSLPELEKKHKELTASLTAINQKYGSDDSIKQDPEYKRIVGEMGPLDDLIRRKKLMASYQAQLEKKPSAPPVAKKPDAGGKKDSTEQASPPQKKVAEALTKLTVANYCDGLSARARKKCLEE